jgi:hypothetical protein
MSLRGILRIIKKHALPRSVYRRSGSYTNGRWVQTGETETTLEIAIQPLSGKELDNVPEGRREKDNIKLFSLSELLGVDPLTGRQPDQVLYDSKRYELYKTKRWDVLGTTYYWALASEVER